MTYEEYQRIAKEILVTAYTSIYEGDPRAVAMGVIIEGLKELHPEAKALYEPKCGEGEKK